MRLAFMGTPDFSVPVLSELLGQGFDVACVYTKAPQPKGRGQKLQKSPVHLFAEKNAIEVRTPKNFQEHDDVDAFKSLNVDAAIVVAYGVILPKVILDAPQYGCFNLHASLLPRWRGAAPIHRAIMAGDPQTGVQVMRMEEGLDTGPILLSEVTDIKSDDTTQTLHDRLAEIGASLLPRALSALDRGALSETPQSSDGITYAHKISGNEARIDWQWPAQKIDAHIRGLSPFPGAWFKIADGKKDRRVKVLMSSLGDGQGAPGEIIRADDQLVIATGDQAVQLKSLQREGKEIQTAADFLRGTQLSKGDFAK